MPAEPPPADLVSSEGAAGELESALPPAGARILAFSAIVVAGLCGGLIGWAVADMQIGGDNTLWAGLAGLVGAAAAAGGVAIVSILVLRAMGEWRTIQHRAEAAPPPSPSVRRPT